MNEDYTFIKLYRKILNNPVVCKDAEHFAVWVYLLLVATHAEREKLFKGEKITLQPGQLITGRKKIAEHLNITESKVQRILKDFEADQQIEQQTCNKNRLITILNWNDYQGSERQTEQQVNSTFGKKDALLYESTPKNEQQLNSWNTDKSTVTGILKTESEQQLNNKRTTTEQQLNTYNNDNNVKNEKNVKNGNKNKKASTKQEKEVYFPNDEKLNQAFLDYIEFRKKIKSPMTDRAIDLAIKTLDKLTQDNDEKIEIINQSIMNGWKGLFPLKSKQQSKSKYQSALEDWLNG